MKLRKYAVSGTKDWTPIREFWTEEGAKRFYRENRDRATAVFKWDAGGKYWWLTYPYELVGSLQADHRAKFDIAEVREIFPLTDQPNGEG